MVLVGSYPLRRKRAKDGKPRRDILPVQVCVHDGLVRIEIDGQLVKTHPARHDPAKELGAYATPDGHPARRAKKAQQQAQQQRRAV